MLGFKVHKEYDWDAVERAAIAGVPYKLLSEQFGVPYQTILKRALRHQWPTPTRVAHRAQQLAVKTRSLSAMDPQDWIQKGDEHRKTAFELAHESMKKAKPKPPRNWKDVEIADKIARRAAGLDSDEVNRQQVLIQINEPGDEEPTEAPVDAVVIEENTSQSSVTGPATPTSASEGSIESAD